MAIKRIGVLTSDADAPGMNAVIRSVVRSALYYKLEVMGIMRGFAGLLNDEIMPLSHRSVSNIINRGGTILKTARCPEIANSDSQQRAVDNLKKNGIEGLILIGGEGAYRGGIDFSKKWGVPCIGIPCTIDNDLNGTDSTIGADTAVNTALDAIDKIRDTATSLERIFVVEVMGRGSGFIALQTAMGSGAEDVILPERKFDFHEICHSIVNGNIRGKVSWIIVLAEGAGKADDIAKKITEMTTLETRILVLGHIQRGGTPTARDRILAARLGVAAVDLLIKGESGKAVGVISDDIKVVDLEFAVTRKELQADNLYNLTKILT